MLSDPPVVSEAVVLSAVRSATHSALRIASSHGDLVGLLDLTDNTLDWVLMEELPRMFTMAAVTYRHDALFCADDFATLRELKQLTHTNTIQDPTHWAIPLFIAPPRLHACQRTALICVAQWDDTQPHPVTNLHHLTRNPPPHR